MVAIFPKLSLWRRSLCANLGGIGPEKLYRASSSVNLDKTKIMIFNKGKSLNKCSFRYGADELENVKSYKYLGLIMSPYGNFNLARQELKKVALKLSINYERDGKPFQRKCKIIDEVI